MKTFIINLDRDRDRWSHIRAQASAAGLDYERTQAVSGRELGQEEFDQHYSAFRAKWRQARNLTPAEIGCALSHLKIYREILLRDLPRALVLEDDVELNGDVPDVLCELESQLPQDTPIVCLLSPATAGSPSALADLGAGYTLHRFGHGFFASSYILTRAAADWLLQTLYPVGDVADCWERLNRSGKIQIFCVTPTLIEQDQDRFGSSTTTDIQGALTASKFESVAYKVRRARNILLGPLAERMQATSRISDAGAAQHPIDTLRG